MEVITAKLHYIYGPMGSSKTANALMNRYSMEKQGKKVLLAKTEIDVRDGKSIIKSRIGLEAECMLLCNVEKMPFSEIEKYDVVIVDECQFASASQIDFLSEIVDRLNIPVYCYGLRTDFLGNLFSGSERLFEMADEISEIRSFCWCGRPAVCNARYSENGIVREGSQVMLGADAEYTAVCRKHYKLGILEKPVKQD